MSVKPTQSKKPSKNKSKDGDAELIIAPTQYSKGGGMKFKYLRVTTNDMMWGKQELSKEYFVSVVQSGDALINLEDMTYFDKDSNEWKPIEGDLMVSG